MTTKEPYFHVLFWAVYMSIFTFVEGGYQNNFIDAFYIELVYLPLRLTVTYTNYFIIARKYLFAGEYKRYIFITLSTIVLAGFAQRFIMYYWAYPVLFPQWNPGHFLQTYRIVQSSVIITSPLIFIMGFTIVSKWVLTERRANMLEQQKLKAELGYLRSQINPHFFFNTLNNLYGLAQEKSDKTAEVVMKLSILMNYILYEADQDTVTLDKEIEYIKNYIELEDIRYGDRFESVLSVEGDTTSVRIAPLLLLPFVENSFKHGVNQESEGAWISIKLKVEGEYLYFTVENSLLQNRVANEGGLGIKNVVKRLNLLYPALHELSFGSGENTYTVQLKLNFKSLKS